MSLTSLQYLAAITAKETRTLLRSRRAFWLMMLTLLAVGGIFLIVLATNENMAVIISRTRFSRLIFSTMVYAQLVLMGLVTPLMTATAFTGEREHKTMDLLYTTAIPRSFLILGKWLAALVYQFAILVCLLPVLALTFQMGGVGLDEYLYTAIVIGLTVAAYGMIGVMISVKSSGSLRAMRSALGLVVLLNLLLQLAVYFVVIAGWVSGRMSVSFMWVIQAFSPLNMVSSAFGARAGNAAGLDLFLRPAFLCHVVFQVFITAVSALIALGALRGGELFKPVIARKLIDDPRRLARRRYRFPFYLLDPLRRPHEIRDRQDPLVVKERRIGGAGSVDNTIRLSYLGLLISFPLMTAARNNALEALSSIAVVGLCLMAISAPTLTATLITREREENTLGLLLTTPCSAWRVVWAKWRAVLLPLTVRAISVTPIALLAQFLYDRDVPEMIVAGLKVVPFILSFVMLYAAAGVLCSAWCRRSAAAIAANLLAIVLLAASPGMAYILIDSCTHLQREAIENWVSLTGVLSPFVSLSPDNRYDSGWFVIALRAALVMAGAMALLFIASRRLASRRDEG